MNRSITSAWASGSSAGTSSRRNRISLNSPAVAADAVDATSAAASSSKLSKSWIVPDTLPPGSAAAAAAREENLNEGVEDANREAGNIRSGDATTTSDMATPKRKGRVWSADVSQAADGGTSNGKRLKGPKTTDGSARRSLTNAVIPTARLKDLGGVTNALDKVLELIAMPLCHPEVYAHTGVKPPRGVLLHGPPGCGKTMLAGALAGELNVPLFSVSSPSIVSGTSGESEQTLRKLFDDAIAAAPCILFLDEIDAITPKRETASREMERRIVAQLLTLLDDLTLDKTQGKPVMVIGATNRPDSLDPALRRAGRFDHEIALGVPDENGREEILRVLCAELRLSGDFDLRALAKQTPGYVGADLVALTAAAGIRAVKRIFSQLAEQSSDVDMFDADRTQITLMAGATKQQGDSQTTQVLAPEANGNRENHVISTQSLFDALPPALQQSAIATFLRMHPAPLDENQLELLSITADDFASALPSIQPSSKREGFATVPEVTWADIGALESTREELEMSIVEPIKQPELFRSIGVSNSGGVLLWGPPGCGKTLLAKAVANESGANFISVKGPELLNKYVGESERAVRQVFARARTSSPCVIFFDELDALVPRRDEALSESSSRVVNTLLTELDGLEARVQTYVIGATNRPDMIDPAMCRPGRLDKLLYVDLPNELERIKILRTLTKKSPLRRILDDASTSVNDSIGKQDEQAGLNEEIASAAHEGIAWLCHIAMDARCNGFSGADLAALVREASVLALRNQIRLRKAATSQTPDDGQRTPRTDQYAESKPERVTFSMGAPTTDVQVLVDAAHFQAALDKVQPSVGLAQRKKYEQLRSRLSGLPGTGSNSTRRRENDVTS